MLLSMQIQGIRPLYPVPIARPQTVYANDNGNFVLAVHRLAVPNLKNRPRTRPRTRTRIA